MVCKFVRAKVLKWLEISNLFRWLTSEIMHIDDYCANLQNFHELAKLNFLLDSVFMSFFYNFGCFYGSMV